MNEELESVPMEEIRIGEMFRIAPVDIEKPRHLTPAEKIALEKKDIFLAQKAEVREPICWQCERPAEVWVREVGYDFKGEKAVIGQHVAVSSSDYPGPVPGFCMICLGSGPVNLAQVVYFDRPEMYWGVRPTRWFVIFTDGTKQGGDILEIDPLQASPKIINEHIGGTNG